MSNPRASLRVAGTTVKELGDDMNRVLERLLGQDRRRYGVEPSRKPIQTVTTDFATSEGDWLVRADASGGAILVTLPPAASVKGLTWTVKKIDGSGNAVTLDADGGELIDGAATLATTTPYAVLRVVSTGTGWDTI